MRSTDIPLVYFTDCLMATADSLAMLSRPPKGELIRHGRIVQRALNTIEACGLEPSSRPKRALEAGGFGPWVARYNADLGGLDFPDAGYAPDSMAMIREIGTFVTETLRAPSARLNTISERERHARIRETIDAHCAAMDRIVARIEEVFDRGADDARPEGM